MKRRRQLLIALIIILSGIFSAFIIVKFPPQTGQQEEVIKHPLVQYIEVKREPIRMNIRAHGRVMAHTEIDLVAEVSGSIVNVSPAFVNGGFFRKGDLLIAIDPADYDLKVAQSQASVSEARHQLAREEAEAEQAREEWQYLGQGDPSPLNLRIPQLAEKRAKLAAAKEALKNAKLLRQRTDIRAPFDGRVRTKTVDVGQFLTRGIVMGTIYSTDLAEVRLPLSDHDLAFVDLPNSTNRLHSSKGAKVTLQAMYLGIGQIWHGQIVRSEGVIDRDTGMMTVIAQIPDPFGLAVRKTDTPERKHASAELPLGLFVEAEIEGRWFDDLVAVPPSALINSNQIVIIDLENQLHFRTVDVLKRERERVFISAGLNDGEKVLVSGILRPIEGMLVTPQPMVAKQDNSVHASVEKEENIDMTFIP